MLPSGNYVGIQVKNRIEYPKPNDINTFIELCRVLHVRPFLVTRQVHPMTFDVIKRLNGLVVVFKQVLLKPGFPKEVLSRLRQEVGILVAVYKWPPDYLVNAFINAAKAIA
jgi:hypothetical protein